MFGIQKTIIRIVKVIAISVVVISVLVGVATVAGCGAGNSNAALAQKNVDESEQSQDNNSQDNTIYGSQGESTAEMIKARGLERERAILAEGRAREMAISASQQKWEIFSYGAVVIGIVVVLFLLIAFKAYLSKSPWDKYRKETF